MLDRLVGRSVLAEADGIVGHHVDDLRLLQRGQADRRPRIVGEDQEGAAVGDDATVQRHAVHRRGHAELADAVIDVAAAVIVGRKRLQRLGFRVVRAGQVGRSADGRRDGGIDRFQRHFRRLARRDRRRVGDQPVDVGLQPAVVRLVRVAAGELAPSGRLPRAASATRHARLRPAAPPRARPRERRPGP